MHSEKDAFLNILEREYQTTQKLLKHFPLDKADFKPQGEKTRSAKDLIWTFVMEQEVLSNHVVKGKLEFDKIPPAPATLAEVLKKYETMHPELVTRVKGMSDADWNSEMDFFVGPGQMGKVRKGDIMWMMLYDSIHHRGQLTIYHRLVGAKVPSIYGPSADEPWS